MHGRLATLVEDIGSHPLPHTVAINIEIVKERLINSCFYDIATAYQSVHANY